MESPRSMHQADQAIAMWLSKIKPLEATERLPWDHASGRILADPIAADRDSPACDVSAMDGYALRLEQMESSGDGPAPDDQEPWGRPIDVCGTVRAGSPAPPLPSGQAMRVFTGAPVPVGAQWVVRREDTLESHATIRISRLLRPPRLHENIRRQGENLPRGGLLVEPGRVLDAASLASAAGAGQVELSVIRRVRLAILNTGDELLPIDATPEPWQIRDSNGPFLHQAIRRHAWMELVHRQTVIDQRDRLADAIASSLQQADALILTGGVSMGDTDHVPQALIDAGGEVVFHRIPIRPGKPMLGGLGKCGQPIFGLPGNPVSVAVTFRRFALTVLRHLAGMAQPWESAASMRLEGTCEPLQKLISLRLVRRVSSGTVQLCDSKGSGDWVSLGKSDGFIELPMGQSGPGPWPFYPWDC
jgi:molybdopterin molybdotransferase